jgi:hypothetical protein
VQAQGRPVVGSRAGRHKRGGGILLQRGNHEDTVFLTDLPVASDEMPLRKFLSDCGGAQTAPRGLAYVSPRNGTSPKPESYQAARVTRDPEPRTRPSVWRSERRRNNDRRTRPRVR